MCASPQGTHTENPQHKLQMTLLLFLIMMIGWVVVRAAQFQGLSVFYSPPHILMESSWSPHGLCITCSKVMIIPSKSCGVHEDSTQNYRVHQFGVHYDKFGVKSTLVGVISHCLLYIIPSNTFYILQSHIYSQTYIIHTW